MINDKFVILEIFQVEYANIRYLLSANERSRKYESAVFNGLSTSSVKTSKLWIKWFSQNLTFELSIEYIDRG